MFKTILNKGNVESVIIYHLTSVIINIFYILFRIGCVFAVLLIACVVYGIYLLMNCPHSKPKVFYKYMIAICDRISSKAYTGLMLTCLTS